jgi:hypothetical protein
MKNLFIVILLFIMSLPNLIFAQTGELMITYSIINDTAFNVNLYIKRTGTVSWNLGTSSFVFNYNNVALTNPRISFRGIWDYSSNPSYSPINMFNYATGYAISLEVDYNSTLGNGVLIPTVPTLIGTIQFHISNNNAYHNMTWNQTFSAVFDDYAIERTSGITFINPANHLLDVKRLNNTLPTTYELYQNYPNPFNSSTVIKFDLPKDDNVKVCVFDMRGRQVSVIQYGILTAGSYSIKYDANQLSSGIYFIKFFSENFSKTIKMILVK